MIKEGNNFVDFTERVKSLFSNDKNLKAFIDDLLELIGVNLSCGSVYLDVYEKNTINNYEWNRNNKQTFNYFSRVSLPFYLNFGNKNYLVLNHKTSHILKVEKHFFRKFNIKSLLIYPIKNDEQIVANLGIVFYNQDKEINHKQFELLSLVEAELIQLFKHKNNITTLLDSQKQLINNFIYPIVILNREFKIIDFNTKFIESLNVFEKNIYNKDFVDLIAKHDHEKTIHTLKQSLDNLQTDVEIFKFINNEKKIYRLTPFPLITDKSELIGIVIKDVTRYKITESKLTKMAFFDSTTGLHNRNYFDQICEEIDSIDYHSIGVIVLDIDNLKTINDNYGHDVGDQAIIRVSKILSETFNEEYLVARIGGDEFAVFILNRTEKEIIDLIAEFNHKITICNRYNEFKIHLTNGYDYLEAKPSSIFDLINRADENMYLNKKRKNKTNLNFSL